MRKVSLVTNFLLAILLLLPAGFVHADQTKTDVVERLQSIFHRFFSFSDQSSNKLALEIMKKQYKKGLSIWTTPLYFQST